MMLLISFFAVLAGCIGLAILVKKIGLKRDTDNEIISGVCAGLAKKFHIQPLPIRAVFVLFFLISGIGILPYIVLWVSMEEE